MFPKSFRSKKDICPKAPENELSQPKSNMTIVFGGLFICKYEIINCHNPATVDFVFDATFISFE